MSWKQVDPKVFANTLAFGIAAVGVVALVTWAYTAAQQAQTYEDPTQKVIKKDKLLD